MMMMMFSLSYENRVRIIAKIMSVTYPIRTESFPFGPQIIGEVSIFTEFNNNHEGTCSREVKKKVCFFQAGLCVRNLDCFVFHTILSTWYIPCASSCISL